LSMINTLLLLSLAFVVTLGAGFLPGPQPGLDELLDNMGNDTLTFKNPFTWKLLRFATWNTMLQPWFSNNFEAVSKEITRGRFDVIALQEVWTAEFRERIIALVSHKYPYSYFAPAVQTAGGCDISITPISFMVDWITCLVDTGQDLRTIIQPTTPIDFECQFLGLLVALTSQPCLSCLTAVLQELPVGTNPIDAMDICRNGTGINYAYGGYPGMLILSRYPIENTNVVYYDTFLIHRAVIYATVKGLRFAAVHLPYNVLFDIDPSFGPFMFGALQPQILQDIINQFPDVILGDFNSGPDYQPEGFQLLVSNNYRGLLDTSEKTYCPASHSTFSQCLGVNSLAIDQIYVRQNSDVASWNVGTWATRQLSDHIGVKALLFQLKWK